MGRSFVDSHSLFTFVNLALSHCIACFFNDRSSAPNHVIIFNRDLRIPLSFLPGLKAMSTETAETQSLDRYECLTCGYIYEPDKGDDKRKVPAGTAFEDVAQDWRCPVCGAPKSRFQNIGGVGAPSGFEENLKYGLGVNALTPGQKNLLIFGALGLGVLFFLSLYGLQ